MVYEEQTDDARSPLILRLQLMDNDRDLRAGTDRAPARGRVEWSDPDPSVGPLTVLYEDPDILAVHKRAGLVCHPSPGHYADTLANAAAAYLRGQGITGRLYLLGRLDRDISGIVVFAKHAEAAAMLSGQRRQGGFEKIYLAEVRGSFSGCPKSGKIEAPLSRIPDTMYMQVDPDGKAAGTFYQVLAEDPDSVSPKTLCRCTIEHGRTHQIRVHMAHTGHPLVGEPLYGMYAGPIGIGKKVPAAEEVDLHLEMPLPSAFYRRNGRDHGSCTGMGRTIRYYTGTIVNTIVKTIVKTGTAGPLTAIRLFIIIIFIPVREPDGRR